MNKNSSIRVRILIPVLLLGVVSIVSNFISKESGWLKNISTFICFSLTLEVSIVNLFTFSVRYIGELYSPFFNWFSLSAVIHKFKRIEII